MSRLGRTALLRSSHIAGRRIRRIVRAGTTTGRRCRRVVVRRARVVSIAAAVGRVGRVVGSVTRSAALVVGRVVAVAAAAVVELVLATIVTAATICAESPALVLARWAHVLGRSVAGRSAVASAIARLVRSTAIAAAVFGITRAVGWTRARAVP